MYIYIYIYIETLCRSKFACSVVVNQKSIINLLGGSLSKTNLLGRLATYPSQLLTDGSHLMLTERSPPPKY